MKMNVPSGGSSLLLFFAGSTLAASSASAASSIVVGSHDLLPNTRDQVIMIFATGDDAIRGFNLRAQIGDGLLGAAEPVFEAVDFTGGLWDAFDHTTLQPAPIAGAEQFFQPSVVLDNTGDTIMPNGLVAKLRISTEGIHNGSYPLALAATAIGEDSDFIRIGGTTFVPTISNGTIVVVPEPNTCWLVLVATCVLLRIRRASTRIETGDGTLS